jgi:hypothetical protein
MTKNMTHDLTDAEAALLRKLAAGKRGMKIPARQSRAARAIMYDLVERELINLVVGRLYFEDAGREALRKVDSDVV